MNLKLTPNKTTVILFQGDDMDRLGELLDAVTRTASTTVPSRIGDGESTNKAIRDYDAFVEEATERAVKLDLVRLPRKQYRDLLAEHPARLVPGEDGKEAPHEEDARAGFNVETLGDALVPMSVADGQFDSDAERDAFIDDLSDGQFSLVYSKAIRLNDGFGPDPKVRLSTHLVQTSDETSEPPERLA